jgi:hypothetical protein
MPDSPNKRHALPRSRVVEVIERSQEEALRQLRQAGIPEQQALAVMRRIAVFCLQTLSELDVIYREFEELVAEDGRSEAHQRVFNDKAAALLTAVEAGIAGIVADTIRKVQDDYQQLLSPPKEAITVPAAPPRREPEYPLPPWLLWLGGLAAWFLLWVLVSGSIAIGVIALGVTAFMWVFFEKTGLVLSAIFGGACLLLLLLL